jgi:glutathione S-transferase
VITLYYLPGSAALAPHIALEEAGADYRLVRVKREEGVVEPPEFATHSPHGRVPLLIDGELVLHESAAIVMHLSDAYPQAALAPEPGTAERAHWYRWLTYLTNTVQPAYLAYVHPGRFTVEEAGTAGVQERALSTLVESRDYLERELGRRGPYLLGERYSSADPFLYMITRWCRRLEPKWWDRPVLGAHYRLLGERPAIQRVREQEGLDDST